MLRDPYVADSWLLPDAEITLDLPPAPLPPTTLAPAPPATARPSGVTLVLDGDAMPRKRRGGTRLDVPFDAVPAPLRDALEPHIGETRCGRFVNVSPQPGCGRGYQVQFWLGKPRGHVRLATVLDPKVGALLVAAAHVDPSLLRAPLVARAWLLEMLEDEARVDEWVRTHL